MNFAAQATALGKRYRRTWALRDCSPLARLDPVARHDFLLARHCLL